ncbi:ABC transporter ATP-binding protein [Reyranella sp. CPCC 100927]|nr:ABC transporter ATP-binding protein [Reyranella sp. CPCC 100927]
MLRIEGLSKSFGGVAAMRDVSLAFPARSLSAVIGPNGAGKTTFFNLISGRFKADTGRILLDGADIVGASRQEIVRRGIGRAFQVASLFPTLTVAQALAASGHARQRSETRKLSQFPSPPATEAAREVMAQLNLTRVADVLSSNLSHGDQKLLDIGLALMLQPRVLLLDEPTAGMGPEERWQMIETVQRLWRERDLTLIFIEHDMDIVFKVAETVRVLSYGAVLAEGTPDEIRRNPAVIEAYLGKSAQGATA